MACSCMNNTTSSDGCLGSNKRWRVQRSVISIVNCRIQWPKKVERILLFRVIPESMFASVSFVFLRGVSLRCHVFVFSCFNVPIRCIDTCVLVVLDLHNVEHLLQECCFVWSSRPSVYFFKPQAWSYAIEPAEFKHVSKRRKRNSLVFPW